VPKENAVPADAARTPVPIAELMRQIVALPSISFREDHVVAALRRFADERGLGCREVAGGNVLIEYRNGRGRRPLVLGAHTDHPGFIVEAVRGQRLTLAFRGGLSVAYGEGERLRIYGADGVARGAATITSVRATKAPYAGRLAGATATLDAPVKPAGPGPAGRGSRPASVEVGDYALWDVDECRIRGQIVHARQCDDLAGAVSVLAALDRMAVSGAPGHVLGLFTRAEESGLIGAAAVARAHALPEDALVVAVECSSMAGGRAEQGAGPIIRVGDAQHIFSPRVTMWMTQIARELAAEDPTFRYQRKLMDAGTTEATAYDLMGYETGAACVALGNYHNAGPRGRIAAETVHLGDVEGLARLFERMARDTRRIDRVHTDAERRWQRIGREAAARLRAGE